MQNTMTPQAAQTPAAATAAVCTMAAPTDGSRWVLSGVNFSYTATPTGGRLTIAWGSDSEIYYVSGAGPDALIFAQPKIFPPNTAVTITLASGAGAVVGSVYPQAQTVF